MSDDVIDVEFELTADDIAAFTLHECGPRKIFDEYCGGIAFILVIALAFGAGVYEQGFTPKVLLVLGVSFGFALALPSYFLVCYLYSKKLKTAYKYAVEQTKSDYNLCFQNFRFTQLRVRNISYLSESKSRWQRFQKIERTDAYVYIYFAPGYAYIIPKRAFADEAAFERFYEKCLEYWNAAQGQNPAAEGAA